MKDALFLAEQLPAAIGVGEGRAWWSGRRARSCRC
ncbi:hypothetical protein H4W33_001893 [Kibdelosporangium phytohabitans]|nr:hypothetical protein [Kibdelosporangium phytohabitans]